MNTVEINRVREVYYGLFSALFKFFDEKEYENIEKTIDLISENSIDKDSGDALKNMQKFLKEGGYEALKDESDKIFYSPVTSFVPVTASYYSEQRDDGKKHLEMIDYVLKSKFRRDTKVCKEHEDHIEFMMLFMQKLIEEELNGDENSALIQRDVFTNVLNEIIDEFSFNIYKHESSVFYKELAIVLRIFTQIERYVFGVDKPKSKEIQEVEKLNLTKIKEPAKERVKRDMDEVNSFVE